MWRVLLMLGLSACAFDGSVLTGDSPADSDGGTSTGSGGPDAFQPVVDPACPGSVLAFLPSNFANCDLQETGPAITLLTGEGGEIDTQTGELSIGASTVQLSFSTHSQENGLELILISAPNVTIEVGAKLAFTGTRVPVIVSSTSIDISGLVFVGANASIDGIGANVDCGQGSNGEVQFHTDSTQSAASGGGGGGFGGAGGTGAQVLGGAGSPSAAGDASSDATLIPLRGGCRGGAGGNPASGLGGGGGGALQLVAANSIIISATGVVTAPGGGGRRAGQYAAGGGGGSGGGLLLEAPTIEILGALTANGGGGGQGNRGGNEGDSGNGAEGHMADATPAAGGLGPSAPSGGLGGDGGAAAVSAEDGSSGINDDRSAGGGGGGGAAGRIRLNVDSSPVVSGVVSPSP